MQAYKLTLRPVTAFGTPLVGDTLFGQICWAIVEHFGEHFLTDCLNGYTENRPFLIVSDAFAHNYLPLPSLPSSYWQTGEETDRKKLKKRQWLPLEALQQPSPKWQQLAKSSNDIAAEQHPQGHLLGKKVSLQANYTQPHNSLNRATHTTGTGSQFAPYESSQIWFADGSLWDIYLLLDTGRLKADDLHTLLTRIGLTGYGRDASIGLGKFDTVSFTETDLLTRYSHGNSVWCLAASCPQNQGFDAANSFYHVQTRFGRHGNLQATAGNPFKKPILMAQTGAVFSGIVSNQTYIGQGISGISTTQPQAVHQGYAPILHFDVQK